ncbi:hypothetical protein DRO24_05635 [Candidatus Bathyarchaeota archaeon]|nr:MAG: hypothetical protein DRQ11_12930 [candidate division KSB1 bacterium]RLI05692.1 MAG: hypothetical protein DRO24_05635 [Candidatus Bathyarchaeota archaeon]
MFNIFSLFKKDPDKLLREATAKKKDGDMDGAIESLREAYKTISKTSVNYTIDPFLRLPLYLQQAGKNDEAWSEFNRLLVEGYPNQMKIRELIPMNHSAIYDKMRLFLQRENKPRESVKFGVFAYLSWGLGLHYQERKKELRTHISKSSIVAMLEGLLKKAKMPHLKNELVKIVMLEIKEFPNINLANIGKQIDQIVLG